MPARGQGQRVVLRRALHEELARLGLQELQIVVGGHPRPGDRARRLHERERKVVHALRDLFRRRRAQPRQPLPEQLDGLLMGEAIDAKVGGDALPLRVPRRDDHVAAPARRNESVGLAPAVDVVQDQQPAIPLRQLLERPGDRTARVRPRSQLVAERRQALADDDRVLRGQPPGQVVVLGVPVPDV
jgi:hypothetical protein